MPETKVLIYREADGTVPLLDWLDAIPQKAQDKCIARVELLEERGYELRRPHCELLHDGIYELRARYGNNHYRVLYAFVGRNIVLLSHGCTKKKRVPEKDIKTAIGNRENYRHDPQAHTYVGKL